MLRVFPVEVDVVAISQMVYDVFESSIQRQVSGMRRKLITILMSLAVVFSMATGGTCASASLLTGKATHCHARHPAKVSLSAAHAGSCHIGVCPAKAGRFFLLPDSSSRRFQTETRLLSAVPAGLAPTSMQSVSGPFPACNSVRYPPRSFIPPSLFSLYCILIC